MHSPARLAPATRDVLDALMATDQARDGLRIAHTARRRSALVYPILADLEDRGWVSSRWQTAPGDVPTRRRLYRLTTNGRVAASEALALQRASRGAGPVRVARPRPAAALLRALPRLRWGTR